MNTTTRQTRIPKLYLTAQTVNPPRFLLHVPNETASVINIRLTSRYSAESYAFAVKGFCALFSAFKISSGTQIHGCTVLFTLCRDKSHTYLPSPKSFVCNLPDSGRRHVTSVFQGLSLSRSVGQVWENPGNEVVQILIFWNILNVTQQCRCSPMLADAHISSLGYQWVHANYASSRARSTRNQEHETWALYKKYPSRVSWVDLSRDRYIALPKLATPAGNTFARGLLFTWDKRDSLKQT